MNSTTLIFRQLFEATSSTYTYIIGCAATRKAVIIDPVLETVERDAKLIKQLDLKLELGLNTHVHADHITGTAALAKIFPSMLSCLSDESGAKADRLLSHGEKLKVGRLEMECRHTPGHTNGCASYILNSEGIIFTGDALLFRGCGRTDFQQGNSARLYDSVWDHILSLPDHYTIFPGHDYNGERRERKDE
ncbi:ethe-1 [Pristionchus pacificus]|nr:ethe-1 [Pristionchus pacificus]